MTVPAGVSKVAITWPLAAMILGSVSCSAFAQILLKHGMSVDAVQAARAGGDPVQIGLSVATSPAVWIGLLLYGVSAIIWLFVLAELDVSIAYAFVALGFLLTMTLGCVLLGEPLTLGKISGTMLVVFGIWLVAGGR